ncbi:cell division protein FtsQ/DivIB [Lacticaseibacillus thailandensis]|uniref:cell division protein FtsQ/DivIB n=1 Tax=Lacticaseibacillus thailandensis TaxID=381741 RepID=UPI0006D2479B|nr:cell division protein FtsQ/DivIB [Lacticaseibacillus thailandensis]
MLPPLILLTLVTGYLALPFSKVAKVRVRGNHAVAAVVVQRASGLTASSLMPAVWLNGQRVSHLVTRHVTRVATAKTRVTGARTVTITVTEHATVGYVQRGNRYHALLDDGTILAQGLSAPKNGTLIFKGFGSGLQRVVRVVAKFPANIRRDISEIQSTRGGGNPYQITMTMNDGNTIVADSRTVGKKNKVLSHHY